MELTKSFEFDAAHRVMHEKVKCFNLHGHRFRVDLTLEFRDVEKLGYAIDFKEVKRLFGGFIDERLDHSCILNPLDTDLISLCTKYSWKRWIMGFDVCDEDINPSAEFIASELFVIARAIFNRSFKNISVKEVTLYETPTCKVTIREPLYSPTKSFLDLITNWVSEKGKINYDDRL